MSSAPSIGTPTGGTQKILNSWKEIAVYLGRGVRTVQRWEAKLGLPVRRPNGHMRSAVIALSNELDEWLLNTPKSRLNDNGDPRRFDGTTLASNAAVIALRRSLGDAQELRHKVERLKAEHGSVVSQLVGNIAEMGNLTRNSKALSDQPRLKAS